MVGVGLREMDLSKGINLRGISKSGIDILSFTQIYSIQIGKWW